MGIDTTDTQNRLRDLETDGLKHSPFAVFGGKTIKELRDRISPFKRSGKSLRMLSSRRLNDGQNYKIQMFQFDSQKFELMADPQSSEETVVQRINQLRKSLA